MSAAHQTKPAARYGRSKCVPTVLTPVTTLLPNLSRDVGISGSGSGCDMAHRSTTRRGSGGFLVTSAIGRVMYLRAQCVQRQPGNWGGSMSTTQSAPNRPPASTSPSNHQAAAPSSTSPPTSTPTTHPGNDSTCHSRHSPHSASTSTPNPPGLLHGSVTSQIACSLSRLEGCRCAQALSPRVPRGRCPGRSQP